MKTREDLTGVRYGMLKVVKLDHVDKLGHVYWLCQCDCGNTRVVRGCRLKTGRVTTCGRSCKQREAERDLTGKRFGRLTVIGKDVERKDYECWLCQCDCGNLVSIYRTHLVSGASTSCGCYRRELCKQLSQRVRHGHHGERLYNIWCGMRSRCSETANVKCPRYSGRGIKVCEEWDSFINFYNWAVNNGYDDKLSIDRIDNDGDYCPENCRWADRLTQQNNKYTSRFIVYNDMKHTLAEWSRILSMSETTLARHIDHGDMRDFEKYFENVETIIEE